MLFKPSFVRRTILLAVISCGYGTNSVAQDAVPGEILERTILIRSGTEQGTAFTIDYAGKLYIITARHVVAGVPKLNATLQVRKEGQWLNLPTLKTLYPSSDKVDIAIFKTDQVVTTPYGIAATDKTGGATMGQQIWFLGYPFLEGLGSHFAKGPTASSPTEFPFIKRGTMSAIDATDPDAVVIYIDGFNNRGFSGGPILFWDFVQHKYRIAGVVQGYKNDVALTIVDGHQVDTNLLVNSGILVGYNIQHAIDAIEKDLAQK